LSSKPSGRASLASNLARDRVPADVPVTGEVVGMNATEAIVSAVERKGHDLIVMVPEAAGS
jgi:hypothetical protein